MPRLSKIGAACLSAFGFGTGASGVSVDVLVIGGGGAGGTAGGVLVGGGGGAGGVAYQSGRSLALTDTYTVVIGAGAAGGATGYTQGPNGTASSFGPITAIGGGGGGLGYSTPYNGSDGGSGGGGGMGTGTSTGSGGTSTQGTSSGATGYGNAGGTGFHNPGVGVAGGGGGGAGGVGGNANTSNSYAGSGGVGLSTWSAWGAATGTGENVGGTYYYAGGGGGGSGNSGYNAPGGYGGGATGGKGGTATQAAGALANTGGGGGGGPVYTGAGGSGLVIVRYLGAQKFGGGVVSTDGTYTYHTFKTSGQLVPMTPVSADYLIVAGGGGGGGNYGGGGAGGLLTGSAVSIDTSSTYVITVGAGGAGGTSATTAGTNGSNSIFSIVSTTAVGGGGGGAGSYPTPVAAGNGGSGGGGGVVNGTTGGTGIAGQGYGGGTTNSDNATYTNAGGGGGAGAVGGNATSTNAGNGGNGTSSSITGTSITYAGGGGGATDVGVKTPGTGGSGGGGNGAQGGGTGYNGTSGTVNLGAGGGGGALGYSSRSPGSGGSGIVVIRYAGTTQLMAGGTVTIVGGYVIHTFTSSGYLTPLTFIGRSLRFRSSASASISRTPTTAGNQKTWTFSAWVKRGQLTRLQKMFEFGANTSNYITMLWNGAGGGAGADQLDIYANSGGTMAAYLDSVALYRDPAAWYHIVFAVDTTQATASNRLKLYVNGNQITSFASASYPTQNADLFANSAVLHRIGNSSTGGTGQEFDGYMADVRLIDGQQLTPNSFGTFNSYGVWQPINYGGSYGTNGFYLPFTNNSASSYAASFNGSSQYLSLPSNSNYALGGVDFTVEGWLYFNSLSGAQIIIENTSNGGSGLSIQTSGSNLVVWSNSQWFAAGTLVTNKWTHFAVVRNGSVSTAYIDGVRIGTTTTDAGTSQGGLWIGARATPAYYFNGYMSNLRWVKGTALYTSDFTPTTSPLTAVSGTQLLTLQNSTFVDNSANNATITNNGSIALSTQYPFSVDLVKDKSPQGNHWTPNNISTLLGSTYDSVTDVPTLTSATAANYCVLNPLTYSTSGYTLSDGNLKITGTSGSTLGWNAYGTMAFPTSGKWYFEHTCITAGTVGQCVGVALVSSISWGGTGGNPLSGAYMYVNDATKVINGTQTSYGATWTSGDVIGVAFDLDAGTLTFYKNNVSQGTATTGLSGTYIPYVRPTSSVTTPSVMALNFGQQPFAYTPPTGYLALNTYNL